MSIKRKIAIYVIVALIVLTIGFIWVNSCFPKAESTEVSEGTQGVVQDVIDVVAGKGKVHIEEGVVRKVAHFFEFAALGAEFCALYIVLKRQRFGSFLEMLPFGLYVSVIDEGIQILSDRGPEVKDIFIDYSGYLAATLVFFIVFIINRNVKNRKNLKQKSEKV